MTRTILIANGRARLNRRPDPSGWVFRERTLQFQLFVINGISEGFLVAQARSVTYTSRVYYEEMNKGLSLWSLVIATT